MRPQVIVCAMLMLASLSLSGCIGRVGQSNDSGSDTTPEDVNADEHNVLYIGHSFGRRFAESLEDYAHVAGFEDHAQYIEFSGGESGSPGLLWEDAAHRANIKAYLDTGEIDVLVMICCSPEFIQTLDTDQAVWNFTDYAVAQNPEVRIGLAMPWKDFPSSFENASEYASNSTLDLFPYWVNLSQNLSANYPGTDVFTFHHGALAYELREMFEAGDLEGDVNKLQGNKATSIFTDDKGHAGSILEDAGTLIWLAAVHGVEPMDYPELDGWETDLRVVPQRIWDDHTSA